MKADRHFLRCFCGRKPLLATYGRDEHGKVYVHIKVYKQDRIFGEVLVYGGDIRIHCRECLRWHRIVFLKTGSPLLEEDKPPEEAAGNSHA